MQAAPVAINVRKLSEDQLIAIERARAEYLAACEDILCGEGSKWVADRKYAKLELLCLEAGMPKTDGTDLFGKARASDAVKFAEAVIS